MTSGWRKESIVEPHTCIFTHILKLGMYFASTLCESTDNHLKMYHILVPIPIVEVYTIILSFCKTLIDLVVRIRNFYEI
jgi:hypothetical protein